MEKLHSNSTFFTKYFTNFFILSVPLIAIILLVENEFWIGFVIAIMVFISLISIIKNYHWNLKQVFLDKENNRLIVEEKNKKIYIDFAEIEKVQTVKIFSVVVVVNLKREIENMNDFIFIPKSYFLFYNPIVKKLNDLISSVDN